MCRPKRQEVFDTTVKRLADFTQGIGGYRFAFAQFGERHRADAGLQTKCCLGQPAVNQLFPNLVVIDAHDRNGKTLRRGFNIL